MGRTPSRLRAVVGGLASLALSTTGAAVRAQASDRSQSNDALYADARAALEAGNYDKACPLFANYYEREPVSGALFALAECEARWPRPTKAVTHFEEFLANTADAQPTPVLEQRRKIANEQIARLAEKVGRIVPLVKGEPASASVTLDGATVTTPAGRPIVVEPGEHVLDADVPSGHVQRKVTVLAGEVRRFELTSSDETKPPSPPPPTQARSSGPAPLLLLSGAIGLSGIIVGGIGGGLALGAKADLEGHCDGDLCDAPGKRAGDRAKAYATMSTIGFAVGIVGIGAAVVLYLVQPKSASASSRALVVGAHGIGASF